MWKKVLPDRQLNLRSNFLRDMRSVMEGSWVNLKKKRIITTV